MEAPRYLAGNSFIGRRDPRVLILVAALTVASTVQIYDSRIMAIPVVLAAAYYAAARIAMRAVWTNWLVVAIFITCLASINGVIVGVHQYGTSAAPLFTLPLFGAPISAVSLSYAMNMVGRFAAITATGLPLAFAVRPGDLAPALSRLGVPDRFAFAVDLTYRLLPTIAANMRETIAAQRLRGYEVGRTCNPIRRIRQAQPLIIPVTLSVFVDAEDIADALDLRCFGTQRRTWLRALRFDAGDIAVLATAVVVTSAATAATVTGYMPPLWIW